MIEAKKLAYEDRAKFYADPEFANVPVASLISKEYAATRAPLIRRDHANDRPTPGEPAGADTIYMTVVDKDFNAVSLIQEQFQWIRLTARPRRARLSPAEPRLSVRTRPQTCQPARGSQTTVPYDHPGLRDQTR